MWVVWAHPAPKQCKCVPHMYHTHMGHHMVSAGSLALSYIVRCSRLATVHCSGGMGAHYGPLGANRRLCGVNPHPAANVTPTYAITAESADMVYALKR